MPGVSLIPMIEIFACLRSCVIPDTTFFSLRGIFFSLITIVPFFLLSNVDLT